jgi:hypothetical protein
MTAIQLLCTFLACAVVLTTAILLAAVVRVMREDAALPVAVRSAGRPTRLHPVRAVTLTWTTALRDDYPGDLDAAQARVRAAMPDLADALDRLAADERARVAAGQLAPQGPCAYGRHDLRDDTDTRTLSCARCGHTVTA